MYNTLKDIYMRLILYLFILVFILEADILKNKLDSSTSPYLKQHATNPINWMPWGNEAFTKAKRENKAVFLSIGYSTCHWCHVMAEESFEDKEIAELFNKYFIPVKVDREEMPHLDSYYQRVHLKVKNRVGGWPLSVFLTHDKKPFYVATYIPKTKKPYHEGLDTLLPKIYKKYRDKSILVKKEIHKIETLMSAPVKILSGKNSKVSTQTLSESLHESYDEIYSGFGRGKKFPEASKLSLIMDLAVLTQDEELENMSYEMLDVMALRGLYDHIEGGFFRYTVDAAWEIPHFEKMLYNQAELIPLYVKAYKKTGKKLYKNVVIETIEMLDKRFLKDNLYYSASDADSNHKEGEFFIFSTDEIKSSLAKNRYSKEISQSLEFSKYGNFEGKVHLNFYTADRPKGFEEFRDKLKNIRETKEFPFIDKKINTAWNSMIIEALYIASKIDKKYAKKADLHLETLKEFMFDRGELYHQSLVGLKPQQKGLLEDYSFFISALLNGYGIDFKEKKLDFAEYLLVKAKENFYRDGIWYLSADGLKIQADMQDKYYPSPLAKMLQNIIKLASLKSSFKYDKLSLDTLEWIDAEIEESQSNSPASAKAYLMQKLGVVTLKSSKENLTQMMKNIEDTKYPFIVLKANKGDDYLACTMKSCFAIDKDYEKVKKIIEKGEWR